MKPTAIPPRLPPTTPEELNKQLLERMKSIEKASEQLRIEMENKSRLEVERARAISSNNTILTRAVEMQLERTEENERRLQDELKSDRLKSQSNITDLIAKIKMLEKAGTASNLQEAATLKKKLDDALNSSRANNDTMQRVIKTVIDEHGNYRTRAEIERRERRQAELKSEVENFREDKKRISAAEARESKAVVRKNFSIRAAPVKAIVANVNSSWAGSTFSQLLPVSMLTAILTGVESLFYIHTTGNRFSGSNRRRRNDGSERADQTSPEPQIRSSFISKLITTIRSVSEKTIVQRFTDMQRSGASDIAEAANKLGLNFIKEKMLKLGSFVGEKFSKLGSFIKTNLTLASARIIGRILEKIPLNKIFNYFSAIIGPVVEKLRNVGTLVGGLGKIITGTAGKIIMALSATQWIKDFLKSPVSWFLIAMVVGYVTKIVNGALKWITSNFENFKDPKWWFARLKDAGDAIWGATIGRFTDITPDAIAKKISDVIGDVTAWVNASTTAISKWFTNKWYEWMVPLLNSIISGVNYLLPARYEISKLSGSLEESAMRKYELAAQTGQTISAIATKAEIDVIVEKIKSGEIKPIDARRNEVRPVLNTSLAAAAMKIATTTSGGDVTVNTDTTKFDESAKEIAANTGAILAAIRAAPPQQQNITVFSNRSKSSEEYMGSLVPV